MTAADRAMNAAGQAKPPRDGTSWHGFDRLVEFFYHLQRLHLAARARRIMRRHFQLDQFAVVAEEELACPPHHTHVQVFLQGYPGVLLWFATSFEDYPGMATLRRINITARCQYCSQVLSEAFLRRGRTGFLVDLGRLMQSTIPHFQTCPRM